MLSNSIVDAIGNTPLVGLRRAAPSGVEAYAKLELQNPFGMKDRVARHVIMEARRLGELKAGAPIIESSSGTMGLGLALVGGALGHPVHIVTDPRIDPITLTKLEALGCTVRIVTETSEQGWQGARLQLLRQLLSELPDAFWPRQYGNPDNPAAYAALADELHRDLGRIDVLVGAVGSGGSLCGSARALRRHNPALYVVGVDSVGSVLFDQPDRPARLQSGLGNSLIPGNLDRSVIDEVHWLNDAEAFEATLDLAREEQIFAGNTSGSVYCVLGELARHARPGTRLVGIFPDRGDRYSSTVYDRGYRQTRLSGPRAAAPATVAYGTPVESWSLAAIPPATDPGILLFIEANTTGTGMLALSKTRDLGLYPVLMTSNCERYRGLEETGAEVVSCDTNSPISVRAAIEQRFVRERLAGVTTTSDFFVVAAAETAAWLGLAGNDAEATRLCRDKTMARVRIAGAPGANAVPRFVVATAGHDMAAAIAHVGLPCVVKPSDESGSKDVLLCPTEAEVRSQVMHILARRTNDRGQAVARKALIEQFLDGPEYSVETFSVGGTVSCIGITEKTVVGRPYFVESGHVFPAAFDGTEAELIEREVRRALAALSFRAGPAHTEVKLTADGPAIIEVNGRLAGGMIPELIRLATGVDLLEQQIRAAAGKLPQLEPTRSSCAGIRFILAPLAGTLQGIAGVEAARRVPGVTQVVVTAERGQHVRPPQNAYDRLGYVIAAAPSHDVLSDALEAACACLEPAIEAEVGTVPPTRGTR